MVTTEKGQQIFRRVCLLTGTLFILVTVALIAGRLWITSAPAQAMIQKRINKAIPGTLSWDGLSLSLVKGEVEVRTLRLQDPAGEPLFSLDRGVVNITWTALLHGELAAEAVTLEAPQLHLKAEENGTLNILTAFPPATPSPSAPPSTTPSPRRAPFNIVMDTLTLTRGSVRYEPYASGDAAPGTHLEGIEFTLSGANLYTESGEATLRLGRGDIAGAQVNRARLEFSLKERQLVLHALEIDTPKGQVTATGDVDLRDAFKEGLMAPKRNLEALAYTVALTQTGTALSHIPGLPQGVRGEVASQLTLHGVGISPQNLSAAGRLRLSAHGLAWNETMAPRDLTLTLQATRDPHKITIQKLTMATGDAHIDAQGSYARETDTVAATVALTLPDLAALKLPSPAADLMGDLTAQITVNGSIKTPVVKAQLLCQSLGMGSIPWGDLRLDANLESSGTLNLTRATLTNTDATIQAQGSVGLLDNGISATLPTDLTVTFHHITADNFVKGTEISGAMDGTLTLKGPLRFPEAFLTLSGEDLTFQGYPMGALESRLCMSQGNLTLDALTLRNKRSHMTLTGTAQLLDADTGKPVETPALDLTLGGKGLFLDDFFPTMTGKLSLAGELTGTTAHPSGALRLTGANLDLGAQTIHGVTLAARLDEERSGEAKVVVDALTLALAPDEEIRATGWLRPRTQAFRVDVNGRGLSLQGIEALETDSGIQGAMDLALSIGGNFKNPQATGEVTLSHLSLYDTPLPDGQLALTLENHMAHIAGHLMGELEGQFDLATQAFSMAATLNKAPLAPFFTMGGRTDLAGTLSGRFTIRGNTASPETVDATAKISEFSISQGKAEIVRAVDFKASVLHGTLFLPTTRLTLFEKGFLTIGGEKRPNGPLNFKAEGKVPLQVMNLFTQVLGDITGEMRLSTTLKGTMEKPDFKATLAIEDMGFILPETDQRVHTLQGQIQITPEAITIEALSGGLDSGRFHGSGQLILENLSPVSVNARLNAQTLPLSLPGTMEALINGNLTLTGPLTHTLIAGDILILEGTYTKDVKFGLIENIIHKKRRDIPLPTEATASILDNTDLQIAIRHRAPFIIDNNLTLMALKPTLTIYGPLKNPHISGRAEVESGLINYLGKEFEITKGVVDFINPYKIEPTFDLSSEVQVRKWRITLNVSGVMENLKFEMSSTPSEADKEILSLLTFGQTTGELISRENGTSQSTKQILADFMTQGIQESLKNATGLDTIELKYTERTDQDHADDINITVGKEISKRMTLKYGVGTKNGEAVQSATTEYKFFENVLMNAFQDTAGDFGGEMMFRLEFR